MFIFLNLCFVSYFWGLCYLLFILFNCFIVLCLSFLFVVFCMLFMLAFTNIYYFILLGGWCLILPLYCWTFYNGVEFANQFESTPLWEGKCSCCCYYKFECFGGWQWSEHGILETSGGFCVCVGCVGGIRHT